MALGRALYSQNCQACHGPEASGGIGPAFKGIHFLEEHGTLEAFMPIVREGEEVMPAFSTDRISAEEIAGLFSYIRSLTP